MEKFLWVQIPPPALLLVFCLFLAVFLLFRKERVRYIHFGGVQTSKSIMQFELCRVQIPAAPPQTQKAHFISPSYFYKKVTLFDYNNRKGICNVTAMKCEKIFYENKHNHEREMPKKTSLKTVTTVVAGTLAVGALRGRRNKPVLLQDRITAITNARIFDGDRIIDDTTVVIKGAYIQAVVARYQPGQLSSMVTAQP
jgi:hypothetical protein